MLLATCKICGNTIKVWASLDDQIYCSDCGFKMILSEVENAS